MDRRAAFLLPHFAVGGTERLTVDLIKGFVDRGAAVDLVLQSAWGELLELLPQNVRVVDLAAPRLRKAAGPLRRYFRSERPDAVTAAMWPLTSVAVAARAMLPSKPRLVLSDHCPLLEQYASPMLTQLLMRTTVAVTYGRADGIVGVSHGLARELAHLAMLPEQRVTAVWNPVPPPLMSGADPWGEAPGPRLLAMGRFKAEKRYPALLRAFAAFAREHSGTLAIVGDGPERGELEALVESLGLAGRVLLPGFTTTPGDWYKAADLYVLSSDFEGFGNVLVEAMHCGLRVVATDCPYGPREVLDGGRFGTLIPPGDEAALAAAIRTCLATSPQPEIQRARAAEFSVERAIDAYWRLMFPS